MTEKGVLGLPVGPMRRWFTEDQCETAILTSGPGAGAVALGLTGFILSGPFPLGGVFVMSAIGAGSGGLAAKKIVDKGFCKVCKNK